MKKSEIIGLDTAIKYISWASLTLGEELSALVLDKVILDLISSQAKQRWDKSWGEQKYGRRRDDRPVILTLMGCRLVQK